MDLSSLNWFAVVLATLAAFILGAVWYSFLFGRAWMRELGFTQEQLSQQGGMARIFGTTLVLTFVMALGLALLWHPLDPATLNWRVGLTHGLFVGLAFVATSMGINYLYQRKSFVLWAIDAGYQVLFLGLQGAIIGAWS